MRFARLILWILLVSGCGRATNTSIPFEPPTKTDTNFERLAVILSGIPSSGAITLHEGLPSEFWEPQALERELTEKKITRLHGYPFYEERLDPSAADVDRIKATLTAKDSFKRLRAAKDCSGFHADYGVQWNGGEPHTIALISLECGEIKLFGPEGTLHCDLRPEIHQQLKGLLANYKKNRPAPE